MGSGAILTIVDATVFLEVSSQAFQDFQVLQGFQALEA